MSRSKLQFVLIWLWLYKCWKRHFLIFGHGTKTVTDIKKLFITKNIRLALKSPNQLKLCLYSCYSYKVTICFNMTLWLQMLKVAFCNFWLCHKNGYRYLKSVYYQRHSSDLTEPKSVEIMCTWLLVTKLQFVLVWLFDCKCLKPYVLIFGNATKTDKKIIYPVAFDCFCHFDKTGNCFSRWRVKILFK